MHARLLWMAALGLHGCAADDGARKDKVNVGIDEEAVDTDTFGTTTTEDWSTQTVPDDPAGIDDTESQGDLDLDLGCSGVFNPDQVLDLHMVIDPADWSVLLADTTYSVFVPGTFACGAEVPIDVMYRRKRSGGTARVGLKVDFNEQNPGQRWQGLRRLTLENGVGEGNFEDTVEAKALIAEYLGWRFFQQGDLVAGRAVFVDVSLNGAPHGVFLNLEQVDKEFLDDRFGENDGWLYKFSGGPNDGQKTHLDDGLPNPYEAYFCFWASGNGCPPPADADLIADLPVLLDLDQVLWFGAINAYLANTDAPIFKANNFYYYDSDFAPRKYIPWDLDTTMKVEDFDVFTGRIQGPDNGMDNILLAHWRPEYETILIDLVGRAPASFAEAELDRMVLAAGLALDAGVNIDGTAQDAADQLGAWWVIREANVRGQLGI